MRIQYIFGIVDDMAEHKGDTTNCFVLLLVVSYMFSWNNTINFQWNLCQSHGNCIGGTNRLIGRPNDSYNCEYGIQIWRVLKGDSLLSLEFAHNYKGRRPSVLGCYGVPKAPLRITCGGTDRISKNKLQWKIRTNGIYTQPLTMGTIIASDNIKRIPMLV